MNTTQHPVLQEQTPETEPTQPCLITSRLPQSPVSDALSRPSFVREVMETESICSCQSRSSCIMGSVSIPVARASGPARHLSRSDLRWPTSRPQPEEKMLFIYLGSSAVRGVLKNLFPIRKRWEREGLTGGWLKKRWKERFLRRNDKKEKKWTFLEG